MSKNRTISSKQEKNDSFLIIEEKKPFQSTNKSFEKQSIPVTFSYEKSDDSESDNAIISASSIELTIPVIDFLMNLFPGEFDKSLSFNGEGLIKAKKTEQQDNVFNNKNRVKSQQKKLIKALAALPLIKKIVAQAQDSQFAKLEEQKKDKLISLITNLIKKKSNDDSVPLSVAFKHYNFFSDFADDFITQKGSNYRLDLTLEQKNNLVAIFPLLQFHRYEPKEDEFKFMIKKDNENATVFDKLPCTLAFIQKLARVRAIYNKIPEARIETRESLLAMMTDLPPL